eukprot:889069_1
MEEQSKNGGSLQPMPLAELELKTLGLQVKTLYSLLGTGQTPTPKPESVVYTPYDPLRKVTRQAQNACRPSEHHRSEPSHTRTQARTCQPSQSHTRAPAQPPSQSYSDASGYSPVLPQPTPTLVYSPVISPPSPVVPPTPVHPATPFVSYSYDVCSNLPRASYSPPGAGIDPAPHVTYTPAYHAESGELMFSPSYSPQISGGSTPGYFRHNFDSQNTGQTSPQGYQAPSSGGCTPGYSRQNVDSQSNGQYSPIINDLSDDGGDFSRATPEHGSNPCVVERSASQVHAGMSYECQPANYDRYNMVHRQSHRSATVNQPVRLNTGSTRSNTSNTVQQRSRRLAEVPSRPARSNVVNKQSHRMATVHSQSHRMATVETNPGRLNNTVRYQSCGSNSVDRQTTRSASVGVTQHARLNTMNSVPPVVPPYPAAQRSRNSVPRFASTFPRPRTRLPDIDMTEYEVPSPKKKTNPDPVMEVQFATELFEMAKRRKRRRKTRRKKRRKKRATPKKRRRVSLKRKSPPKRQRFRRKPAARTFNLPPSVSSDSDTPLASYDRTGVVHSARKAPVSGSHSSNPVNFHVEPDYNCCVPRPVRQRFVDLIIPLCRQFHAGTLPDMDIGIGALEVEQAVAAQCRKRTSYRALCAVALQRLRREKSMLGLLPKPVEVDSGPKIHYDKYLLTHEDLIMNLYPPKLLLENSQGWVATGPPDPDAPPKSSGRRTLIGLDCEMCTTKEGPELTRVTMVNENHDVILDMLVKPDNPIIDYNTEYSGITSDMLELVETKLKDAQKAVLKLINTETILVGHSLENDLRALKMVHEQVIDSACVYIQRPKPPKRQYKVALKTLSKLYLDMDIQCGLEGHNSAEDALASLMLIQRKLGILPEKVSSSESEMSEDDDVVEIPPLEHVEYSDSSSDSISSGSDSESYPDVSYPGETGETNISIKSEPISVSESKIGVSSSSQYLESVPESNIPTSSVPTGISGVPSSAPHPGDSELTSLDPPNSTLSPTISVKTEPVESRMDVVQSQKSLADSNISQNSETEESEGEQGPSAIGEPSEVSTLSKTVSSGVNVCDWTQSSGQHLESLTVVSESDSVVNHATSVASDSAASIAAIIQDVDLPKQIPDVSIIENFGEDNNAAESQSKRNTAAIQSPETPSVHEDVPSLTVTGSSTATDGGHPIVNHADSSSVTGGAESSTNIILAPNVSDDDTIPVKPTGHDVLDVGHSSVNIITDKTQSKSGAESSGNIVLAPNVSDDETIISVNPTTDRNSDVGSSVHENDDDIDITNSAVASSPTLSISSVAALTGSPLKSPGKPTFQSYFSAPSPKFDLQFDGEEPDTNLDDAAPDDNDSSSDSDDSSSDSDAPLLGNFVQSKQSSSALPHPSDQSDKSGQSEPSLKRKRTAEEPYTYCRSTRRRSGHSDESKKDRSGHSDESRRDYRSKKRDRQYNLSRKEKLRIDEEKKRKHRKSERRKNEECSNIVREMVLAWVKLEMSSIRKTQEISDEQASKIELNAVNKVVHSQDTWQMHHVTHLPKLHKDKVIRLVQKYVDRLK